MPNGSGGSNRDRWGRVAGFLRRLGYNLFSLIPKPLFAAATVATFSLYLAAVLSRVLPSVLPGFAYSLEFAVGVLTCGIAGALFVVLRWALKQ